MFITHVRRWLWGCCKSRIHLFLVFLVYLALLSGSVFFPLYITLSILFFFHFTLQHSLLNYINYVNESYTLKNQENHQNGFHFTFLRHGLHNLFC